MSQSTRPLYTDNQIKEYLDYIGKHTRIPRESCDTQDGLDYLNELLPLQMARVPFENLDLHYSFHHVVSLDPEYLFHKIVSRKVGRGGYCMQNNLLFGTILRSLGYKVMPCGARVSSGAGGERDPQKVTYGGWSHTVNIVHINGRRYFVDVGFGSNNPSVAIPLEHGWTGGHIWSTEADDMQLQWTHIAESTFHGEEQKLWVYSNRFDKAGPWIPLYCFCELEFIPQDFHNMSYYVSHSLHSFFTYAIVVRICVLDKDGNDIGDLTLFNSVFKLRKYGKSEILLEAKSEEERIQGLEKYFGIKLDPTEARGIKGYVSMIGGK